jgi:TonB family protein
MGYQAVLFCPDEKLTRVVSQVFGEVDFVVEAINDPFTVVKKLMAQHYDAIVVDCENEQSSSLLFKSAHNSPFNQHSLAIALVEGQAGVAKAYRIGANLVLTKPINVEQAKGTLRVARGLLRKSADMAGTATTMTGSMPAKEAHDPTDFSIGLATASKPVVSTPSQDATPAFATPFLTVLASAPPLPAMNAWGKVEELPAVATPSTQVEAPVTAVRTAQTGPVSKNVTGDGVAKSEVSKPAGESAPVLNATPNQAAATAAAPAPAKVAAIPAEEKAAAEEKRAEKQRDLANAELLERQLGFSSSPAASVSDGLSFAAFREQEAAGSGGSKKILIVTVAFLALAAAAYFGWSAFGGSHSGATLHPATVVPEQQPMEPKSDLAPMSHATAALSSAGKVNRQSTSSSASAPKTSPSQTGKLASGASSSGGPSERISPSPEPAGKGTEQEPIRVRPDASTGKTQAQSEATFQPPSPLAVESADSANLKGLVDSETNFSRPTLAQIKISQGISQGLLIKSVQPKYPAEARSSHAQGAVQIEATIDKEGNVVHPKVLSGNSVFAKAALDAVRQWRYKPYLLNGEPVEIKTQITINFRSN